MADGIGKKITRFIFWFVTSLLGLVALVFLLIQLPVVQSKITTEVEKIARTTLGTDVGIGSISLKFPRRVDVDDVYVNNPEGDTIARVGHLGVAIDMWALLRSTADISSVEIDDVYANVITTDSSSNIQFLLDAFMPVDTLVLDSDPAADSVAASSDGFLINLDGAALKLTNADVYYQDDPAGLLADVTARELSAEINEADLTAMHFDIDYVEIAGTDIAINLGASTTPVDTTAAAAALGLEAGRFTISESSFRLGMDSLDIATNLNYVNLEGAEVAVGDSIAFRGELFQLRDFAFSMDTPLPALTSPGIDYNHLSLSQVEAEVTDIAYLVDSLHLRLRQLSAAEKGGLVLERTEGTVDYSPSFLGLRDFLLRTANSELKSENTAVNYDFAAADLEQLVARAQLDGHFGMKDIALIAPDLAATPVVNSNLAQQIDFSVRADGTVADMEISRIQITGPGIKVSASGQVSNLLDPDRIGGRLRLRELSITAGAVTAPPPCRNLTPRHRLAQPHRCGRYRQLPERPAGTRPLRPGEPGFR